MVAEGLKLDPRNLDRELYGGGLVDTPEGPQLVINVSAALKLKDVFTRLPTDKLSIIIRLAEEEIAKRPDGRR